MTTEDHTLTIITIIRIFLFLDLFRSILREELPQVLQVKPILYWLHDNLAGIELLDSLLPALLPFRMTSGEEFEINRTVSMQFQKLSGVVDFLRCSLHETVTRDSSRGIPRDGLSLIYHPSGLAGSTDPASLIILIEQQSALTQSLQRHRGHLILFPQVLSVTPSRHPVLHLPSQVKEGLKIAFLI